MLLFLFKGCLEIIRMLLKTSDILILQFTVVGKLIKIRKDKAYSVALIFYGL